ncbi:phosphoenolpyruvate--protein phosphotransferase [Microbacterium betulae]|uniref:Phosphoenolpyruvate-protein phosphotransferase n=1 Tax=Microbacterium betulae TaxID=2981139 RepID=A0AA97I844_9MICO|nr:phosphoenolpyruvate--protein phosphotransferase [Microbacterium sp. AB]WOF24135.1 phosphoenolpyruvate--protein phosphotransferase [Microbacterium sp. AB]
MSELRGVGIGQGVAHGPIARMAARLEPPRDEKSTKTPDDEKAAVAEAVAAVAAELNARGERAGGAARDVLEAQAMMAEDPTLEEGVHARIDAGSTGEWAVHAAFAEFAETLQAMGGYLGERAADLADVAQRVIAHLRGVSAPGVPDPGHPFVLVAPDLAPADTVLLDLDKVLAVVTTEGGPTSHTAILAGDKGIVAVVGTGETDELVDGATVIVDAASGVVTVDPSDEQLAEAAERAAAREAAASAPVTPGALADGTPVPLLANLGNPDGAAEAVALGAEGVGLFRTEFLFLSSEEAPTVESQTASYTRLLEAFPGKKVVVRALDAGADKPLKFLTDAGEENPALGRRGLRALRHHEEVLRDQLTALANAEAATDADLWVMAPMVATVEEADYFTRIAREHGIKTAGVMIEVPSVALLADAVFEVTDFGSVGTNDLVQYTMAADRMLGSVSSYQDPWHPAVLRLIAEIGRAGTRRGKPVGICGQAAADPLLAVVLVGLGATTLSMSPPALVDVRAELKKHTLDDARRIAEAAVAASDAASARAAAQAAASA